MSREHAFHHELWQAIEHLGTRCHNAEGPVDPDDMCPMCDECDSDLSAAQRALFVLIAHHRPEPVPDVPEGKALPPGWRPTCLGCTEQIYPCVDIEAVAYALGFEWTEDEG